MSRRASMFSFLGVSDEDIHSSIKTSNRDASLKGRLKRVIIKDSTARRVAIIFDLIIRLLACLLYVIRVIIDDQQEYDCYGYPCATEESNHSELSRPKPINWYVVAWVHRPFGLWIAQVVLSFVMLSKFILQLYVVRKQKALQRIFRATTLIEVLCTIPVVATVFWPDKLQNMFYPTFLNCWLANDAFLTLFNDIHIAGKRFQSISESLSQQLFMLIGSLCCLIFTTICGIQHIQRATTYESEQQLNLFQSFYFVIVTFTTVGYGDFSPDYWLGQLFMLAMIVIAFAFIPRQLESIGSTFIDKKKEGKEFSKDNAKRHKHVVVFITAIFPDVIMDFLNEFFAHPDLQCYHVVFMASTELNTNINVVLKDPKWGHRVHYLKGSALKDMDLDKARVQDAQACFILAERNTKHRSEADQHTILRSWAVKDFAPHCPQYLQLFLVENRMHVKSADCIVCEDEFKYALFANNCMYPGISTLVTLMLHTYEGDIGKDAPERWQKIYGRHSGNELYHISLENSLFFSHYIGKSFTEASADAHAKFGVCLLAVEDTLKPNNQIQLNPGSSYTLKKSDICYYLSITQEEYAQIKHDFNEQQSLNGERRFIEKKLAGIDIPMTNLPRDEFANELQNLSEDDDTDEEIESLPAVTISNSFMNNPSQVIKEENENEEPESPSPKEHGVIRKYSSDSGDDKFYTGLPPVVPFVGARKTLCHLERSRMNCCLKWASDCEHCSFKNAKDPLWNNQLIILAAEKSNGGIYNFIVPLRSYFLNRDSLRPIILLFENEPSSQFLYIIAHFPLVYWLVGTLSCVDDLLKAGITKASQIVVVKREMTQSVSETTLMDTGTILAAQQIFKLFPSAKILTELDQASNMRFMNFRVLDNYSMQIAKLEKKIASQVSSNLCHMFRLPFAAGRVFSASMLDTLLYQTFEKGYLIAFIRLFLGIDSSENSGHLSSIQVRKSTLHKLTTYGELYKHLCETVGEIPIALYRSEPINPVKQHSFKVKEVSKYKRLYIKGEVMNNSLKIKNSFSEQDMAKPNLSKRRQSWRITTNDKPDIASIVTARMGCLDMKTTDYNQFNKEKNIHSYIILNPSVNCRLKNGDLIYVIQPAERQATPVGMKKRNTLSIDKGSESIRL
ncbi:potassium channel subfamily T member 1 isoform X2 [Octopus sinensis]|uniref:Potassium channel subfamily T member 1 isoform X2 n=1 Tax=Octopus sinensis TaxID=2607531 RepID=A0A7E6EPZ7_9MOLL|nr:potassium channel subfamily T member 1 isoform X2 [Octopus sinensis]